MQDLNTPFFKGVNMTSHFMLLCALGQARRLEGACRIYVLNATDVAAEHGLPGCDLNEIVVDSRTQARAAPARTAGRLGSAAAVCYFSHMIKCAALTRYQTFQYMCLEGGQNT